MNQPRILVVDDNATNLGLVASILELEGYEITQASDAEAAQRLIAESPPQLILMDVGLPGMDGLTLTRKLKGDPATRHILIAIVTAAAMKGDESRALGAGGDAYITKPIDTRALPGQIAQLLGKPATSRRAALNEPEPTEAAPVAPVPPGKDEKTLHILVVDDHASNRLLLREVLESAGHGVFEAADGEEGLAQLDQRPIDAVISDALMPNMDGFRMCLEVRKSDRFNRLPFVVYTSTYDSPADRSLAGKVGADCYLIKPAPREVILATLREALRLAAVRPQGTKAVFSEEVTVIKQYNTALVAKLEEKNEELQAALERFRQLAENIHEVFWLTDPEKSSMLYVSPAYETVWGRSCESLVQAPMLWLEAVHREDRERVQEAMRTKQVAGSYDEQYRIIRPDGAVRWVRDRAFPVRDEAGRIYRVAGVAEDITENKELQTQFLRAQRLESIGALASGIAHDLNNILAPIMMSVPMLRWGLADDETEKILGTVEQSAQRGAMLIKQLLTFGRGAEGERVAMSSERLLAEMAEIIEQTFPKDISVQTKIAGDLWPFMGDPTQLHQVLLNLCVNARDAMPDGGMLTLGAENVHLTEAAAALVPGAQAGSYAVLWVRDTGTGIPAEIADKIFDPFFTTKEAGKGTGLGLATVLGIVKSHGGCLQLKSEVGQGTEFRIFLPGDRQADVAPERVPVPLPPKGNDELILVVDDETNIRESLWATLVRHGYQVVAAANGMDGAALYMQRATEIRLVITDLEMPTLDGAVMLQLLKRINPGLTAIVSSGVAGGKTLERKREALAAIGITVFVDKPYDQQQILSAVHRSISAGKSGAA